QSMGGVGGKLSWPPPRLTRVNHALRATEPLKLRKGHCSREARTQPFGQYTEIRVDVISRPANPYLEKYSWSNRAAPFTHSLIMPRSSSNAPRAASLLFMAEGG